MGKWILPLVLVAAWACSPDTLEGEEPAEPAVEVRPQPTPGEPEGDGLSLVLLGTGTPIPESSSGGPASAVIAGPNAFLVDLGEGVVRKARKAFEMGHRQLRTDRLGVAFVTHLHSDHTLGLPDYLFTPWIVGRRETIRIFGPPGIKRMVDLILETWSQDLSIRENGNKPRLSDKVKVTEIVEGVVFKEGGVTVTAFGVSHGDFEHAFGFRFDYRGRSVVISGDTRPDQRIVENCDGCDILLHEVYSKVGFDRGPPSWRRYHSSFHTSTVELAKIAEAAGPGTLVLYHKLFFGQSEEGLLKEVTSRYDGDTRLGRDLDVYPVPAAHRQLLKN